MTDKFNTIAGWTLFAGIMALGLSIVSDQYFGASKPHRPHEMGFPIEGVAVVTDGGGPDLGTLLAMADPAKGEATFAKCMACHTINQGGAHGIGPNLFGIVGKPIGTHAAGFAYSSDLAGHGGEWDYATLDNWLKSPKGMVPGTKMSFPGLGDAQDRANVLAYLKANGGGPDFPAPAAPAEEAAGGDDAAAGPETAAGADEAGAAAQPEPAPTQNAATAND